MKKIILFTIFFALFALNVNAQVYPTLDQRLGAFAVDTITVGTTPVQLRTQPNSAWCQFMHTNATDTVYFSGDTTGVGLTTATGWGGLTAFDTTERYPVTNNSVFYMISTGSATIVRILWGKDGTPD